MSTAVIITDFEQMEIFINKLDDVVGEMYQCQSSVNHAYNHISDWDDKIFRLTGKSLMDTGNKVEQLSAFLCRMMGILNEYCRRMNCEYAEYSDWSAEFHSRDLETQIHLEDEQMRRAILGTTAEGIKSFENELEKYIDNTSANINKVTQALDEVRNYWKDDNFRTTEDRILTFRNDMRGNLSDLENLHTWIVSRRIKFEENENIIRSIHNA